MGGGGLVEFDAEFKFVKIQNSHVEGGGGSRNLMPSSNLLKSKILMLGGGGGLMEFDAESKFATKKNFFCEKFSKFSDKNWNGFVLDFEYRVVPLYEV